MSDWRDRGLQIRTTPRPGDLGAVTHIHGTIYAAEYGLDLTFEPYVARPLSEFMLDYASRGDAAGRLWIVETVDRGRVVGSIAIVDGKRAGLAQLRWFILAPEARGVALGRHLLGEALAFARAAGWARCDLATFDELHAAMALYRASGFEVTARSVSHLWGRAITEIEMSMDLLAGKP